MDGKITFYYDKPKPKTIEEEKEKVFQSPLEKKRPIKKNKIEDKKYYF